MALGPNKDLDFGLTDAAPGRPDGAGAEMDIHAAAEAFHRFRCRYATALCPAPDCRSDLYAFKTGYAAGAAAARGRWKDLVAGLLDPGPCRYDHNGLCQAHQLDARPCPHEQARAALESR